MNIKTDYSLKNLNTFKVDATAKHFAVITSEQDLQEILSYKKFSKVKKLIIGSGANILFTKDFNGLVLKVEIKGIKVIKETAKNIYLEIGSGEDWHDLVTKAVNNNWGGIENLALIPGRIGAAPVQNIAAYGQNLTEVFVSLDAISLKTGEKKVFGKKECKFGYRTSIFKTNLKDKYLITSVRLKLNKNPKLNISYFETGKTYKKNVSLENELDKVARKPYTIKNVYDAVINIRTKKFPDISKKGTAGSFFKNPIVNTAKLKQLLKQIPDLQYYPLENLIYNKLSSKDLVDNQQFKIPVAKLLDELGWKGKRFGNAGVHKHQAVVVVNHGNATGNEILELTKRMQNDVYKHFKIRLEPEVKIIN